MKNFAKKAGQRQRKKQDESGSEQFDYDGHII